MKKSTIFITILLIIVVVLAYLLFFKKSDNQEEKIVVAKLINVEPADDGNGSNYIPSAGYFEGRLFLSQETGEDYEIFVCSEDWSWVELDSCYEVNLDDVNANVESHKFSAELSGCYVGALAKTTC
jgi:hypothetical protein